MKLFFVARTLDLKAGGVQRMVIAITEALAARGHDVSLFTWDRTEADPFYRVGDKVRWHRLAGAPVGEKAGLRERLSRLSAIRKLVKDSDPDVIVAFQDGPFRAIRGYTAGLGIPVVAAERASPERFALQGAAAQRRLAFAAYRFASAILVQTDEYAELYPAGLRKKLVTIPNPVAPADVVAEPDRPGENGRFRLLSVGRLEGQKNHAVLLEAFARVSPQFPDWDLVILGEGSWRKRLETIISERSGLAGRVAMPGTSPDVGHWYATSHLFCLPSRWEGFPNVLAEALAHGLPSIGFGACGGVNTLIQHEKTGLIAEGNGDAASLTAALQQLMARPNSRAAMGQAARASVSRYKPEHVITMWEDMLRMSARR